MQPLHNIWTIIAIAIVALVLLAGVWWLWWRLPQRQMRGLKIPDDKGRADTEDNFRKTVGQAIGGAAVLSGAVFAYLQFSAQQQATRDQLQSAHDLLISNQVSKGFEQLAGDKPAMKLGGIYALEGVMKTSPEYHQSVLEALCAFVRDETANKTVGAQPTTDVQATLTVIGRRREQGWYSVVNLAGANIPGADLSGADLSFAKLNHTNLTGANLGPALLSATTAGDSPSESFQVRKYSSGANLTGAILDDTNLTGVDLSNTRGLTQDQLNQACGKPKALPPGMTLDRPCPPAPQASPASKP